MLAAVSRQRRHTNQLGDRVPVELPEFGALGEHRRRCDRSDPGNAVQQVILDAPDVGRAQAALQVVFDVGDPFVEPGNMRLEGKRSTTPPCRAHDQSGTAWIGSSSSMRLYGHVGSFSSVSLSQA